MGRLIQNSIAIQKKTQAEELMAKLRALDAKFMEIEGTRCQIEVEKRALMVQFSALGGADALMAANREVTSQTHLAITEHPLSTGTEMLNLSPSRTSQWGSMDDAIQALANRTDEVP